MARTGVIGGAIELADDFLQIKIGGDLALFQALGHLLVAAENERPGSVLDGDIVKGSTNGSSSMPTRRRTY